MERKLKRVLAWVLAITLIFSCTNSWGVSAKANDTVRVYFELPEGTTVSDWGANVWTNVTVTGHGDFTPEGWGTTKVTGLLAGAAGWGYVDVTGTVEGFQFVKKDATQYECWNSQISALGLPEAYYDPAANKWYKEREKVTEITAPVLDDIFYVTGTAPFTWNLDELTEEHQLKETAEGSKIYTITKTGLSVGEHLYKIVQDPADFGWKYQYFSEGKNEDGKNSVFTINKTTDTVTIKIDKSGAEPVVTAEVTPGEDVGYTYQEGDIKLYLKLPEGTTAADWGLNVWTNVTIRDAGALFTPEGWGTTKVPGLKEDASKQGWAYIIINGAVEGCQFVTKDASKQFDCWNSNIQTQELKEAYYDSAAKKWYKEAEETTEIVAPVLDDIFYVTGSEPFIWELNGLTEEHRLKETAEGSKIYTLTKTGLTVGEHLFKVVQDPADFGWKYQYFSEKKTEDGKNSVFNIGSTDDMVTITLDNNGAKPVVTAVVTENPKTYGVTVVGGNCGQVKEYAEGAVVTVTADEPESGKVFDKWISDGADVVFADSSSPNTTFKMPAKAVTVTASYKTASYTVTFKDGDTVLSTQTVEYGKDANAPEVQAKEGYTLSWDKPFTGITGDTTVNAVWTANKYTVTFKDGDTVISTQTVEHGKDANAPEVQAKEGYTLSWDKAFTGIKADTTVNAVWTANKYTVTFKDGDIVISTQEVEYGKDANAPEVQAKEGHTLSWDKAFTGIKADTTVNAVWTANKYTVTFKNGSAVISTQTVEYGKNALAPESIKKTGYSLSWDKKFDNITSDVTVNAVWTANKYTVKFNKNGGTVSKTSKAVKYDSKYGTLPTAKRKGYTFSGWYTSKNGGKKVTSSVKVSTAKTHTLYARWTKVNVGRVSIKSLKAAKKQMTVTFKKVSGVKGYEIVYATNSKFKPAKKLTTTSTKAAIKNLKSKSTVYVKVRAYKIDSTGNKVYGSYSSVKKVKIK